MKIWLILIITSLSVNGLSQHTNFNTQANWALDKKGFFFGAGATQFNGDLGGFSFSSTSWNASAGYRIRFRPFLVTSSKIRMGQLRGDDAQKDDLYYSSRNLHFRTTFAELSQRIELIALTKEPRESRYGIKGMKPFYYDLVLHGGIGIMYFSPKARHDGTWIALHPLKTEGQGLGGPDPYSRITAVLPLGLTFKWKTARMWKMGIELEYTFTFSNYLDDVGGTYFDSDILSNEVGASSAYLSNPSTQNHDWFETGQPRGNDKLDGYFSISLIFDRNTTYKDYTTVHSRRRKGRYKFGVED